MTNLDYELERFTDAMTDLCARLEDTLSAINDDLKDINNTLEKR